MRQNLVFIGKSISAILLAICSILFAFRISESLKSHFTNLPIQSEYLPLIVTLVVISFILLFQSHPQNLLKRLFKPTIVSAQLLFYLIAFWVTYIIIFSRSQHNTKVIVSGSEHISDSILVYTYPANGKRHEIIITNNDTVVNAEYNFDSLSRRQMPERSNAKRATLFFGCSYTFGDGVSDRETLPYHYYINDSSENVYNYAIDGWGPQQTFSLMRSAKIRNEVVGDTVTGIYVFIDDHLRRVICDKHHVNTWTKNFACYGLEHDSLIYRGTFASVFPARLKLFNILAETKVFDGFDIPIRFTDESYRITTELIRQSALAFHQQFRQGEFYVVIYPGQDAKIAAYLQRAGIKTIDLSLFFKEPYKMLIPNQGHPWPHAYELVAGEVYRQINSIKKH